MLVSGIRQIAEAHGIAKIASAASIKRDNLSRALSTKGTPRFDTVYAVVHTMGLQLTVIATNPKATKNALAKLSA